MNFLKDTAWKNLKIRRSVILFSLQSKIIPINMSHVCLLELYIRHAMNPKKLTVAYVNKGQDEIIFCKRNDDCLSSNDSSLGLLDMATTIVHEARHIRINGCFHEACRTGPLDHIRLVIQAVQCVEVIILKLIMLWG